MPSDTGVIFKLKNNFLEDWACYCSEELTRYESCRLGRMFFFFFFFFFFYHESILITLIQHRCFNVYDVTKDSLSIEQQL